MSETPQTDSEAMDGICCYGDPLKSWDYKPSKDGEVVPAEFARKLERERDEARRERDEALQRLSVWHGAVSQMKKQLSFAPPFHQGMDSQEEAK